MSKSVSVFLIIGVSLTLGACSLETPSSKQSSATIGQIKQIEFVKYELENGLDVILHVDRSDPIVAIDLTAHVGSAREIAGRTGFAHLFEHLLFLDSENLAMAALIQ
ncbi:MAG: insulinase family protein [Robiginitomaculum sp.]|nr:insulinase family protein [Robiginitomaculum sp.]